MKQVVYWVTLSISARISEVTVLSLGAWGHLNNLDFNSLEFEGIRNKAGRYGGTYAHKDIAFEFESWLNPEFNPPLFHVRYEDFRAIDGIDRLELREGSLPPRVLGLVMEWAELHQTELRENWTTLAAEGNFRRIAPLV